MGLPCPGRDAPREVTACAPSLQAAQTIHGDLRGEKAEKPVELPIIKPQRMKLTFYPSAPRNTAGHVPVVVRMDGLETEVNETLSEEQALAEAARCMSCGQCSLCGACWMYCQDNAIKQPLTKGNPYEFKMEYCQGCKKCAEECPCGYIEMF